MSHPIGIRDIFDGNDEENKFEGGRGRDVMRGEGGDDHLDGGNGRDSLRGGEGADNLTGGRGADRFIYANNEGGDTINDFEVKKDSFALNAASFGIEGDLAFQNVARTDDNDVNAGLVHVDTTNNVFVLQGIWNNAGEARNALLDVGVEGPFLFVYYNVNLDVNRLFQVDENGNLQQLANLGETEQFAEGVNDDDAIAQLADFSSDNFSFDVGDRLVGNNRDNEISGREGADELIGRGGDDILEGQAGDDILSGGRGDDVLRGGEGADDIRTGSGDDKVAFADGEGGDTIEDFSVRNDAFLLDAGSFETGDDLRFQNVARTDDADVNADLLDVQEGNNVFVLQGIWNNAGEARDALVAEGVEGPFFFVYYNINLDVNRLFHVDAEGDLQQLGNLGETDRFADGVNDERAIRQLTRFDEDNFELEFFEADAIA